MRHLENPCNGLQQLARMIKLEKEEGRRTRELLCIVRGDDEEDPEAVVEYLVKNRKDDM